jgi:hypothetical protein
MPHLILQATPFVEMVATKLQAVYLRLLRALDAFAEAKMRNAIPEWQLRKGPARGQPLSPADAHQSQTGGAGRALTMSRIPTWRGLGEGHAGNQPAVDESRTRPLASEEPLT